MADTILAPKSGEADEALAKPVIQPELTKLIGSVSVEPATVQPGQPVLVQVLDGSGKPYTSDSPVVVSINGVPVARRYLQFVGTGRYTLQVRAVSGSSSEMATATVTVAGAPLMFRRTVTAPAVSLIPKLVVAQTFANHYLASFTLGVAPPSTAASKTGAPPAATPLAALTSKAPVKNVGQMEKLDASPKLTPQATSYKWSFGDGTTATTQSPTVTHDYFPAIQAGIISHAFDVSCTVEHDNVTVTRTLVLHSAYELCKGFGTIVPQVESDVFATWHKNVGFSASMTVYNIESEPITLNAMGLGRATGPGYQARQRGSRFCRLLPRLLR
jgi:hypothetical protein